MWPDGTGLGADIGFATEIAPALSLDLTMVRARTPGHATEPRPGMFLFIMSSISARKATNAHSIEATVD